MPFCTNTSLVRGHAHGFADSADSASRQATSASIVSVMSNSLLNHPPPALPGLPLRVDTAPSSHSSTNQREMSGQVAADRRVARSPRRESSSSSVLSSERRCLSPDGVRCTGLCDYDLNPHATVVSIFGMASDGQILMTASLRPDPAIYICVRGPVACLGRSTGFAHCRAMSFPRSAHLSRIWPFYGL